MSESQQGRGMVTVACGAAVLVGMLAFLPIVGGGLWWLESCVMVVVALAAVAGTRALGLVPAAAAIIGLTTVPIIAALIVSGSSAAAGSSPSAAARAVIAALEGAFQQIYVDSVPAPGTAELALLMAGGAAGVAVVADFVTVGLRAPVAGTLVIVATAIVPGKAFGTGTEGLLLVAVAAAALAVLAADRRRRGTAPRVAGLAVGGAVAVVVALLVQVVLPTPYATQAAVAGAPIIDAGANPLLRLGQDLRRGATTPVLDYTSRGNQPVYLRLAVLEDFRGDTWAPNPADGPPLGTGAAPAAVGSPGSTDQRVTTTTVEPASPTTIGDRLPLPYPAVSVVGVDDRFRWERRGLTLARYGGGAIGPYTVSSAQVTATPDQLRAASVTQPPGDQQSLELPSGVPAVIRRTADRWTKDATTPYDSARAIQNQLRNGAFSYDESTPAEQGYDGDGLGVIAKFLDAKAGYCIHFASTMAVMARLEGIPSRIVVGYQPGTTRSGTTARSVTSDDLHAWPELYFDGIGWVRFEPTPGRGAVPTYAPLPSVAATSTPTDQATTAAPTKPSAAAAAGPTANDGSGLTGVLVGLARAAGAVLLVVAVLALPGLLRRVRRRRRLARLDRDGPAGAWREVMDTAVDLGLPSGRGLSPRGVEEVLAGHTGTSSEVRDALTRLRTSFERQAYSRRPGAADAADARLVLDALRSQVSGTRRFAAAVAPRSLLGTLSAPRLAFGWSPPGSGWLETRRSPGR